MVMELLGSSLQDLLDSRPNDRLSLKTVLMLADQMLERVETIHSRGIIHRNVKPGNFVMGRGRNAHKVYIIDFGVSTLYRDETTGEHIEFKNIGDRTGNPSFTSPNSHHGYALSRRDDLFSLGYSLVYLLRGWHPWISSRYHSDYSLASFKEDTADLCKVLSLNFLFYSNTKSGIYLKKFGLLKGSSQGVHRVLKVCE